MAESTAFFRTVEAKLGEPRSCCGSSCKAEILFLDAPTRERLAGQLTAPEIRNRAKELRRTLEMPQRWRRWIC